MVTKESIPSTQAFERLRQVICALRHPQNGCPWDLEQNHESLRRYMLEEAYEASDAMQSAETDATPENLQALKDELGDVLLQVFLNAQIAEDRTHFTIEDICEHLIQKMVYRHPHVFGNPGTSTITNAEDVSKQWQHIKATEKKEDVDASVLAGIGYGMPALSRAAKVSHAAVKAGFAWPNEASLWACFENEVQELKVEIQATQRDKAKLEDELGDVLFACATLAKQFDIDPETAAQAATKKFEQRFRCMEAMLAKAGHHIDELDFESLDAYWQAAKAQLRQLGKAR